MSAFICQCTHNGDCENARKDVNYNMEVHIYVPHSWGIKIAVSRVILESIHTDHCIEIDYSQKNQCVRLTRGNYGSKTETVSYDYKGSPDNVDLIKKLSLFRFPALSPYCVKNHAKYFEVGPEEYYTDDEEMTRLGMNDVEYSNYDWEQIEAGFDNGFFGKILYDCEPDILREYHTNSKEYYDIQKDRILSNVLKLLKNIPLSSEKIKCHECFNMPEYIYKKPQNTPEIEEINKQMEELKHKLKLETRKQNIETIRSKLLVHGLTLPSSEESLLLNGSNEDVEVYLREWLSSVLISETEDGHVDNTSS